jgi:molybdate transport system substrate-binding protein
MPSRRHATLRAGLSAAVTAILWLAEPQAVSAQGTPPPGGPGPGGPMLPGVSTRAAEAKPGDIRLMVSNGIRVPLEAVRQQAQQAGGHPLAVEYGASLALKDTMAAGQAFELALVTPEVIDEMIAAGRIVPGSRVDIARVPVSIGQRGDAPKSDISTPAALKQTLLKAKSIRWAPNGASLPTVKKMLAGLDLEKALDGKVNLPPGQVQLGPGEYELNINLASEIRPSKTFGYLGDIPGEFNLPAVMSAGVGSTGNQAAAKSVIAFLRGPALDPHLKAAGMLR